MSQVEHTRHGGLNSSQKRTLLCSKETAAQNLLLLYDYICNHSSKLYSLIITTSVFSNTSMPEGDEVIFGDMSKSIESFVLVFSDYKT